jgi:RNA polymerase sigma-70 factor (ECF subfamily)
MKDRNFDDQNDILSDEDIIELYWRRSERAISETDTKYGKYLFTIAYNIVHDRLDSEECLNDTYIGTWNSIPPHRPNVFQVFLSRITRNIAIDKYREKTADKRVNSELTVSLEELNDCVCIDPSIEEQMLVSEISKVLNDFLASLSEREKFIFVCRYYYSDSVINIAKMLQVTERTVFRNLAKSREKLRKELINAGIKYE